VRSEARHNVALGGNPARRRAAIQGRNPYFCELAGVLLREDDIFFVGRKIVFGHRNARHNHFAFSGFKIGAPQFGGVRAPG